MCTAEGPRRLLRAGHDPLQHPVSSTLSEVIANADLINDAIPTEDEFGQAIARLAAVGVVGVSDDGGGRYWPPPRKARKAGVGSTPAAGEAQRPLRPPPER